MLGLWFVVCGFGVYGVGGRRVRDACGDEPTPGFSAQAEVRQLISDCDCDLTNVLDPLDYMMRFCACDFGFLKHQQQ